MAVFDPFDPLRNITPRFTEEQLNETCKWFDENAQPQLTIDEGAPINVITIEKFINFLELKIFHRRNFKYPTYAEIMNEAELLKAGVTRVLTKEQFIYMLDKCVVEPKIKDELLLAFTVYDSEKRDFLEVDDIKVIVESYDDPFNESETREMLRDANVSGTGYVYYEEFVNSLFNLAPELYDIEAEYVYPDPNEDPSVPPEPIPEEVPLPPLSPPIVPPTPPTSKPEKRKKK